jgi:hypothetical protein|tara:strand:- start:50 stop:319 length:270 start_codon:yes stop_codon:yes gene_type:complete
MTKADSERKKIYSNQPNLSNNKGKFNVGFFTYDNKSKISPNENLIKTFKDSKPELDPNITYQKKIGKDTELGIGMSSKGKGFIKIKKIF